MDKVIYTAIGFMVLANLGTIFAVATAVVKITWFLSKLESRVASIETHHKKDIDAAHEKLRDLKRSFHNGSAHKPE